MEIEQDLYNIFIYKIRSQGRGGGGYYMIIGELAQLIQ